MHILKGEIKQMDRTLKCAFDGDLKDAMSVYGRS